MKLTKYVCATLLTLSINATYAVSDNVISLDSLNHDTLTNLLPANVITKVRKYPDLAKYLPSSTNVEILPLLNFIADSNQVVVVKCYADWCGPCQQMKPIIKEVADELPLEVVFIEINVDDFRDISRALGVRSIPTLMFFKHGKLVARTYGMSKQELIKKIKGL